MNFNERLKNIRKRSKVTQKSVSEHLGVTLRTYQRYEEGTIEPPIATVRAIAEFFDLPTDYLLGDGFFDNWDEILLHREQIENVLKEKFTIFSDRLAPSELSEGQLARLLSAIFTKITFDGSNVCFYLRVQAEIVSSSTHADES